MKNISKAFKPIKEIFTDSEEILLPYLMAQATFFFIGLYADSQFGFSAGKLFWVLIFSPTWMFLFLIVTAPILAITHIDTKSSSKIDAEYNKMIVKLCVDHESMDVENLAALSNYAAVR